MRECEWLVLALGTVSEGENGLIKQSDVNTWAGGLL